MKNFPLLSPPRLWLLLPLCAIVLTGCGSKQEAAKQPVPTDPQAAAAQAAVAAKEGAAKDQAR